MNCLHGLDVRSGPPGPVDPGLGALAERIAALDAEVVVLQEVDRGLPRSHGVDQVAVLAQALGCTGVFAPALHGDPDRRWTLVEDDRPQASGYGVGLLSQLPIVRTTRIALPGGGPGQRGETAGTPASGSRTPGSATRGHSQPGLGTRRRRPRRRGTHGRGTHGPQRPGWDREPRVALRADVQLAGTTLAVTTTHLSYLPWRGIAQLRVAAAAAARDAPAAVLAGDLNLPAWLVRAACRRRGVSGWQHAGGEPTYPVQRPRAQPDQVLVRGAIAVEHARAGPATTSDHLPLVTELQLAG